MNFREAARKTACAIAGMESSAPWSTTVQGASPESASSGPANEARSQTSPGMNTSSAGIGHVSRLQELFQRLAAHRGIDLEVGEPRNAHELFEHEEIGSIAKQTDPVTLADEVLLLLGEAFACHQRVGILEKELAKMRPAQVPEEAIDPQSLDALPDVEDIGTGNLLNALELRIHRLLSGGRRHAGSVLSLRLRRLRVLIQHERHCGSGGQIIILMQFAQAFAQRAAHRQPHDAFDAFGAAKAHIVDVPHAGELHRVFLEQLEKAHVPFGVVEAGALAVHLVRQAAGTDDHHLQILGIRFHRTTHCLPELVAAHCGRQRILQHVNLDRNDRSWPVRLVRPKEAQWRIEAVIERLFLEDGEIEFLIDQRLGHVGRELGMPFDRRYGALAGALVGDLEHGTHAQGEGRIEVEEDAIRMIVVEDDQDVGLLPRQPVGNRLVALEERLPCRVLVLALVEGEPDGGYMRGSDAADDGCHEIRERYVEPIAARFASLRKLRLPEPAMTRWMWSLTGVVCSRIKASTRAPSLFSSA